MLLLGDSLAVGMAPHMPRATVVDARVGRPMAEGFQRLRQHGVPRDHVLLVSLGTNDSPGSLGTLSSGIRQALKFVGPDGVVVWATVYRRGLDYSAFNARLRVAHARNPKRFKVVESAFLSRYVGPDGVHMTPTGYAKKAERYLQRLRAR